MYVLYEIFKQVIGLCSLTGLGLSVLSNNADLSHAIHSDIFLISCFHVCIVLHNDIQVPLNFFHQQFWIPPIPGEVQFRLFNTFPMSSNVTLNSSTSNVLSFNCSSIPSICGCSSFLFPDTSPKIYKLFNLWYSSSNALCLVIFR